MHALEVGETTLQRLVRCSQVSREYAIRKPKAIYQGGTQLGDYALPIPLSSPLDPSLSPCSNVYVRLVYRIRLPGRFQNLARQFC